MKRATTMSANVEHYLEFRRGLGYRLKTEGQPPEETGPRSFPRRSWRSASSGTERRKAGRRRTAND